MQAGTRSGARQRLGDIDSERHDGQPDPESDADAYLTRIREGAARMQSLLSDVVDYWAIATPGIWAGIGTGLFFVPLTVVSFASIPKAQYDEAAGPQVAARRVPNTGALYQPARPCGAVRDAR